MEARLARVEEWSRGHEERCEDRQRSMGREIGELKVSLGGLTKGAWGVALGLCAWALVQLYGKLDAQAQAAPAPPAAYANAK